jgi:transposase
MAATVSTLMNFIPEEMLDEIASETKVDKVNTYKLQGKAVFQILLYSILEENKISLRVVESVLARHSFNVFYKGKQLRASKSGLSDRLKIIPAQFFEQIFQKLSENISTILPHSEKQEILRFDSTILTLSSKLLKSGYPVANGPKNQIKFSIGFNNIPRYCTVGSDKSSMSEDIALKNAIFASSLSKEDIVVFDRGLSSRKTFKTFSQQQISFVTRLNDKANYRVLSVHHDAA